MKYRSVLDPNCLSCLRPLSAKEVEYWNKEIDSKPLDDEKSVARVSCVKCAKRMGRIVPKELLEAVGG